ncbi:lipopolysaccharide assembly LapA domain-containing protein [Bacillus sp. Marseille-Q3570]|uniref:LapA family protein n=1 Tax=Bacillus sp. Marseille-Q3570 TaxID=2963522 RepID=UPI0021B7193C|nr:lipopolysaccharide assembly protein LapA domain-containing protein [Bacillus sp. Marseille-Q3570]
MRREWSFIIGLLFAIIIAVFAVINVEAVEVDYLFGTAQWPLVLVILGSTMFGALAVGVAGAARFFSMKKELRALLKETRQLKDNHKSSIGNAENDPLSSKNTANSTNASDHSTS